MSNNKIVSKKIHKTLLPWQKENTLQESNTAKMPSCVDPESFVRGGSTLTTFFLLLFFVYFYFLVGEGREGHHRPASWRADDDPTLNACLVAS